MSTRATVLHTTILLMATLPVAKVHAVTINTNFVSAGNIINGIGVAETPATNTVGGGDLESIFRAAADVWETLILDDHELTLNFGWYPTNAISPFAFHKGLSASGDPRRETLGSIAFNSAYQSGDPLFLDPTPTQFDEYDFSRQDFDDFGAGDVEIRREFSANTEDAQVGRDLYSIALHEIGHALGLVGWDFFEEETADGDIDIDLDPIAGSELPVVGSHLQIVGALMSTTSRPAGVRRQVTQVDLASVCQLSQFEQCDLSVRPIGQPADANADGDVDGQDMLAWQRDHSGWQGSLFTLEEWEASYGTVSPPIGELTENLAVIPEPSCVMLLLWSTCLVAIPRRLGGFRIQHFQVCEEMGSRHECWPFQ